MITKRIQMPLLFDVLPKRVYHKDSKVKPEEKDMKKLMRALACVMAVMLMLPCAMADTKVYKMGDYLGWYHSSTTQWGTANYHHGAYLTEENIENGTIKLGTATCTQGGTVTVTSREWESPNTPTGSSRWCTQSMRFQVEALGHNVSEFTPNNDATCDKNGTQTGTCDRCGESVTVEIENSQKQPTFTNYIPNGDATCTHPGTETAYCDDGCGVRDTRPGTIDPDKHIWSAWESNGDDTHSSHCTLNSEHGVETRPCRGGTATTTERAICVDCGGYYGSLAPAVPETGDEAMLAMWFVLAAVSAAGMFVILKRKRA